MAKSRNQSPVRSTTTPLRVTFAWTTRKPRRTAQDIFTAARKPQLESARQGAFCIDHLLGQAPPVANPPDPESSDLAIFNNLYVMKNSELYNLNIIDI
ncbi:hypothetical protein [Asticcacaulis benevestitus]|uniref:hypothetical protein n=1 Tax=Asticcacaulis benevestitus TaxID=347481 RepID=UPI0012DDC1B3|nr:hypothetical protein [Asticcacaulis benevestitus]